jgi:glycosyltransferase involved in cell wall biosynthesis
VNAFITLSHNEGMSIAHLEALSHGLPMILTKSSNLDHLEEYGAGILTNHNPSRGAEDIAQFMADSAALAQASRNARRLIEEKFSWDRVIPQLVRLYEEIIASRAAES